MSLYDFRESTRISGISKRKAFCPSTFPPDLVERVSSLSRGWKRVAYHVAIPMVQIIYTLQKQLFTIISMFCATRYMVRIIN